MLLGIGALGSYSVCLKCRETYSPPVALASPCVDLNSLKERTFDQAQVIFVLGGPGAGKGTNCARLANEGGFVHLSAGDLLRAERKTGSKDAALINSYIKDGKIVPVEITVGLIRNAMLAEGKKGNSLFLIDGFPRNANNLEGWEKVMDAEDVKIRGCLVLSCPEEVLTSRLLERGKTSGRVDDNIESIKKRLATFENESKPIIDVFSKRGKVRTVISDASMEEVYQKIVREVAGGFFGDSEGNQLEQGEDGWLVSTGTAPKQNKQQFYF